MVRKSRSRWVCGALATALVLCSLQISAHADRSFFTARRTFGVLFVSGSLLMAKKSLDYRRDANDIYDGYKLARTAEEAGRLFQRANDRDTKSQMSLGISLVMLASGLRLLLSSGVDDNIPKMDRRWALDVKSDVQTRSVKVAIQRGF